MSDAREQFEMQVDSVVQSGNPEYLPWMSDAADVVSGLLELESAKEGFTEAYVDLSCLLERIMTWSECAHVQFFEKNDDGAPISDAVKLEAAARLNALAAEFGLELGCVWDPD